MNSIDKNVDIKQKTVHGTSWPSVGLGTYQLHGMECIDVVEQAIGMGYRHVDTAENYENQSEVGRAIQQSSVAREELKITTKIWFDHLNPSDLKIAFQSSLIKLKTDYIDLLLIHWPNPESMDLEKTLRAMEDLKENGELRNMGVSNFTPQLLNKALKITDILANQVEYHPYLNQNELLNVATENNIFFIAYSPLARAKVTDDNRFAELSEKYGKTHSQIALRWLIQQQNVITIPKSSTAKHLKENMDVFDFHLTEEEMLFIANMAEGHRIIDPAFAPDWRK